MNTQKLGNRHTGRTIDVDEAVEVVILTANGLMFAGNRIVLTHAG